MKKTAVSLFVASVAFLSLTFSDLASAQTAASMDGNLQGGNSQVDIQRYLDIPIGMSPHPSADYVVWNLVAEALGNDHLLRRIELDTGASSPPEVVENSLLFSGICQSLCTNVEDDFGYSIIITSPTAGSARDTLLSDVQFATVCYNPSRVSTSANNYARWYQQGRIVRTSQEPCPFSLSPSLVSEVRRMWAEQAQWASPTLSEAIQLETAGRLAEAGSAYIAIYARSGATERDRGEALLRLALLLERIGERRRAEIAWAELEAEFPTLFAQHNADIPAAATDAYSGPFRSTTNFFEFITEAERDFIAEYRRNCRACDEFDQFEVTDEVILHWGRNELHNTRYFATLIELFQTAEREGWVDTLTTADDDEEAFHRNTIDDVIKVISDAGHEWVFSAEPPHELVTADADKGTFNLGPIPRSQDHVERDIIPWLLWGSGPNDITTFEQRYRLMPWWAKPVVDAYISSRN